MAKRCRCIIVGKRGEGGSREGDGKRFFYFLDCDDGRVTMMLLEGYHLSVISVREEV